jgi:hypothetical protein
MKFTALARTARKAFERCGVSYKVTVAINTPYVSIHDPRDFFAGPYKTHRKARITIAALPHVMKKLDRTACAMGLREVVLQLNPWGCGEKKLASRGRVEVRG